jgi:hypothetical protein
MLVKLVMKFSTQRCYMRLCARFVGYAENQVQFTMLLHATLCMLSLFRWLSSSVHNAASCVSMHVILLTLEVKFSTQCCFISLCARYVGDSGNQVQYTTLLHATLCTVCWRRWWSNLVHNAASCESVQVTLVTLLIKFSKQRFFMRICACYVGDVGNQVHYTTLHLATLCTLRWWSW